MTIVGGPAEAVRTRVDLVHVAGKIEHWVRFGRSCAETIVDRRRRSLWFQPGAVFAYVRWRANAFGTVVSRIDILAAVQPGESCSTVPGVYPGASSLLRLSGWPLVERVLAAIDAIDGIGIDPSEVCPDHWRQIHHRLAANVTPPTYSASRHRAWHLRRGICSC